MTRIFEQVEGRGKQRQSVLRDVMLLGVISLLAVGCTTQTTQSPTHRWQATHVADEVQYRNDHARCQQQAELVGNEALDSQSPAFDAYKQCMNTKGYVLTAYRN